MRTSGRIKMSFNCSQDWNAMKPSKNGRYCDLCKKEVHDFTTKTLSEVNELGSSVCGIFLPEHVEEELTPIKLNFFSHSKYYMATLATILGLEVHSLKAQDKHLHRKTEIAPPDSIVNTIETEIEVASTETEEEIQDPADPLENKHPFLRTGRKSYYWTKKFPFIIKRRHFRMGAKF